MKRNLLLITADQWRGDCLSVLRHAVVQTPHLDALAAEGTLFKRHYANAVPCGPSRACMHTGMYLHNHRSGTNGTPLDTRFTNWAIEARRHGYDPALFGYTHTAADPRGLTDDDPRLQTDEGLLPGVNAVVDMATHCGPWRDWLSSLGYPLPADHGMTYAARGATAEPGFPRPSLYDAEHTDTFFLTQRTMDWIEGQRTLDGPGWIAHLSLRAPHPPWVAAAPYHRRYPPSSLPKPVRRRIPWEEGELHPWLGHYLSDDRNQAHADADRHRLLQASYYGLMSEVDDNLGRLIRFLKANREFANTLILFTSDHGEQMGDHWLYGKSGFFDGSYHIPLIIRLPQGQAGQQIEAFTEHVDIMPTVLQWLGIAAPRQCDGHSLLPLLQNGVVPNGWRTAAHWEYDFRDSAIATTLGLPSEVCSLNVLRTASTKYVHFAALPPLLFDLRNDPQELQNVIASPHHQDMRAAMLTDLLSWRMSHTDKTLSHMSIRRGEGLLIRGNQQQPVSP